MKHAQRTEKCFIIHFVSFGGNETSINPIFILTVTDHRHSTAQADKTKPCLRFKGVATHTVEIRHVMNYRH
jgi:hypothetical protein